MEKLKIMLCISLHCTDHCVQMVSKQLISCNYQRNFWNWHKTIEVTHKISVSMRSRHCVEELRSMRGLNYSNKVLIKDVIKYWDTYLLSSKSYLSIQICFCGNRFRMLAITFVLKYTFKKNHTIWLGIDKDLAL